ncbi:MAG: T9SS type A sorting domain-containing protein, partial [Bacteroidota bacterium]
PIEPLITYTYQWYQNGQPYTGAPSGTAQIITPNVQPGDIFSVDVIQPSGCNFRLNYIPYIISVNSDFTFTGSNGIMNFTGNPTTTNGTPITTWNWSFPGGNPSSSTGQSPTNIAYPVTGTYTATLVVSIEGGCTGTIQKVFTIVLPAPSICAVTVDSLSKYNLIVWDKTPYSNAGVDSFIVYREVQSNVYKPLCAVPYSALSLFVDTFRTKYFISPYYSLGDPNAGTYRYKLQVHDTCGNYSELSPYHNTIFMINNNGTFSWPQLYTIEDSDNPVISYLLKRDNLNDGNWQIVNSVTGSQQSITDPQYSTYQNTANWRIETQWNITCTPALIKNPEPFTIITSAKSNAFKTINIGINELSLENTVSIYPNPTTGKFQVSSSVFQIKEVEVYNMYGEKTYSQQNLNLNSLTLDLQNGIYFLQLKTEQGTINKKIVIQK